MKVLGLKERGKRIKEIRESKYVTAMEIVEYIGISRSSYSSIETGKRDMKCCEALKIAEFLNVHPNRILGFSSPRVVEDKVRKAAIDNGFDVARQIDGRIDISPRLIKFAIQVVDQVHS